MQSTKLIYKSNAGTMSFRVWSLQSLRIDIWHNGEIISLQQVQRSWWLNSHLILIPYKQSCRPLIASAPARAPAQSASDERRSCFSPLNLAAPPPTVSAIYISTQQLFLLPGDRFSFCPPDIRWRWPLGGGAVQWAKKPAHRSRLALSLQLERRSRQLCL